MFHTLLYADFLEDPVTWALLGIGTALAYAARESTAGAVTARPDELPAFAARGALLTEDRQRQAIVSLR